MQHKVWQNKLLSSTLWWSRSRVKIVPELPWLETEKPLWDGEISVPGGLPSSWGAVRRCRAFNLQITCQIQTGTRKTEYHHLTAVCQHMWSGWWVSVEFLAQRCPWHQIWHPNQWSLCWQSQKRQQELIEHRDCPVLPPLAVFPVSSLVEKVTLQFSAVLCSMHKEKTFTLSTKYLSWAVNPFKTGLESSVSAV